MTRTSIRCYPGIDDTARAPEETAYWVYKRRGETEEKRVTELLATALLNSLLDLVRDDINHPLYSLVAVVGDLIEAYEIDHEPLDS